MDKHRCAILVATFNGEKYIREQIISVLKQKDVDINIFISDDNSSDSTLEVLDKLNNNKIEVICSKPKGSAAKNFFNFFNKSFELKLKDYDFFALCDQDDIWPDDHLITSIELIKKNKVDLTGSNVKTFGKNIEEKVIKYNQKQTEYDYLFQGLSPGFTFVFTKKLFSDLYINLKHFNDYNIEYHDWFIYSFARQKNYLSFVRDFHLMNYRQHENNHTGSKNSFKGILWRIKKIFNSDYKKIILRNSYLLKDVSGDSNFITDLNEGKASIKKIIGAMIFSRRLIFERIITIIPILQIMFTRDDFNN